MVAKGILQTVNTEGFKIKLSALFSVHAIESKYHTHLTFTIIPVSK